MTLSPPSNAAKLKQFARRRLPKRRDDSGLTTLEWLLIVAAVAGLAALAVVLVQTVVGDTSEQIAGSSARKTAAQVAAQEIQREADSDTQPDEANTYAKWVQYYAAKCERIGITFADVDGLTVKANFTLGSMVTTTDSPKATNIVPGTVTSATLPTITDTQAGAHCSVT